MNNAFNYFYTNATDDELDRFFTLLNDFMRRVENRKEVINYIADEESNLKKLIKDRMIDEGLTAEEAKGYVIEELTINKLLEQK